MPMKGSEIGIASMVASLVLAVGTAVQWIQHVDDARRRRDGRGLSAVRQCIPLQPRTVADVEPVIKSWTWWQSGGIEFGIGQHIDGLAVMMLLLVAFISTLVQIYSLEYVRGDRRYTHFFAAITLFSAGMLTMVLAENMVQLILGWEIMGLCSFMLIGHWWEEERQHPRCRSRRSSPCASATSACWSAPAIMFGASSRPSTSRTGSASGLNEWAIDPATGSHACCCGRRVALFIACIGKSGQFPLHTWLPDAMAGPDTASARCCTPRRWWSPACSSSLASTRCSTPGFDINVAGQHFNMIAVIGGITIFIAAGWRSCRTTSRRCWPTRPSASSAT